MVWGSWLGLPINLRSKSQEIEVIDSLYPRIGYNKIQLLNRKIMISRSWTLFGPQNSIFDQFCHMGARFASQRLNIIIFSHLTWSIVTKITSVEDLRVKDRARVLISKVFVGTPWKKICLKPVPEGGITTRNTRNTCRRCLRPIWSPLATLNDQKWSQETHLST